jgi:hypothetical protein
VDGEDPAEILRHDIAGERFVLRMTKEAVDQWEGPAFAELREKIQAEQVQHVRGAASYSPSRHSAPPIPGRGAGAECIHPGERSPSPALLPGMGGRGTPAAEGNPATTTWRKPCKTPTGPRQRKSRGSGVRLRALERMLTPRPLNARSSCGGLQFRSSRHLSHTLQTTCFSIGCSIARHGLSKTLMGFVPQGAGAAIALWGPASCIGIQSYSACKEVYRWLSAYTGLKNKVHFK